MAVRGEMQRRSYNPNGEGKRNYYNNARNALGGVLTCASCGAPFCRHTWDIHDRKEVVWRCRTRVEDGPDACMARTIKEKDLQDAIVSALNSLYDDRKELLPVQQKGFEEFIARSNTEKNQNQALFTGKILVESASFFCFKKQRMK